MKCCRCAFTVTELLVALCILVLLSFMIFPSLSAARQEARTTQCAANLRHIGIALQSYVSDFDGTYPPATQDLYINGNSQNKNDVLWQNLLAPYLAQSFPVCPDRFIPAMKSEYTKNPGLCGYAYNFNLGGGITLKPHQIMEVGTPENVVRFPSLLVAVMDSRVDFISRSSPDDNFKEIVLGGAKPGAIRHQNGANHLFADGHVKWYRPAGLLSGKKSDGVHPGFGL